MNYRTVDLITAKRDGAEHTQQEISALVAGYTAGDVADYQMSAWLMAVMFRGLSDRETLYMTEAMVASGVTLNWSDVPGPFVDKHSTGGVGDKTSLIVVPILAANGVKVAKLSGRGLGNTGGTLDKLDSIPGFSSSLSIPEMKRQVAAFGACLCGQTSDLVPADKKLYALRDAAGSVTSTPLIASSIMSKKLAAGAQSIVLDVKVGSGAFIPSYSGAKELAEAMLRIGSGAGRDVVAVLTDMDSPLGRCVGNALEVQEVLQYLEGHPEPDFRLKKVVEALASESLQLAGICKGDEKTRQLVEETVTSGRALTKFEEIIAAQGGDLAEFRRKSLTCNAEIRAPADGYITSIRADSVGLAAMHLGAGRDKKEDVIDYDAGITIEVPLGEQVEKGTVLAKLYSESVERSERVADKLAAAWTLWRERPAPNSVVLETIRASRTP